MALTLNNVYKDKAARVNSQEDNVRFIQAFMSSLYEVFAELEAQCHITPTYISSPEEDTGLNRQYLPVISAGLDHFLTQRSEWNVDDPVKLERTWLRALSKAAGIYYKDNTIVGRYGDLS
ncbi:MAG: hypothetical protein O3A47_06825 [Chloroflexi bacterium]|nr:hypothetical protein [Chloroflexota bacterium]